jgi:hypothetical protein
MKLKMTITNVDKTLKKATVDQAKETDAKYRQRLNSFLQELKADTPVDTGEARDAWHLEKKGHTAVISNSTEHIVYLNQGSSTQAPSRFIEAIALRYGVPIGQIVEVVDTPPSQSS